MALQAPFNFKKWIDDNRDQLKPPVGNAQVFREAGDLIVMVVGGPNARKDYHYNESEEFFFQLEGDIVVKVIDEGKSRDIHIKEGEIFLLPAKVPHSPQRGANTVGMVVEKVREEGEIDGFLWVCENCGNKLYEEFLELTDIVKQLPPVMKRFYDNETLRTCANCGTVMAPPAKPALPDSH
ncbi:MAG: 3-hydroxyanthranilate 3,4-dioxygenase [Bacteroidota bacterium]|nr:3-hydroxyanthranilate 3,4-dioxygenase [Bacteroidota bacterium]